MSDPYRYLAIGPLIKNMTIIAHYDWLNSIQRLSLPDNLWMERTVRSRRAKEGVEG